MRLFPCRRWLLICSQTALHAAPVQGKSISWQSASQAQAKYNKVEGHSTLLRRAGLEQDLNLHPAPEAEEHPVTIPQYEGPQSSVHRQQSEGIDPTHQPATLPAQIGVGHEGDSSEHDAGASHGYVPADLPSTAEVQMAAKPRRVNGERHWRGEGLSRLST